MVESQVFAVIILIIGLVLLIRTIWNIVTDKDLIVYFGMKRSRYFKRNLTSKYEKSKALKLYIIYYGLIVILCFGFGILVLIKS